MRPAFRSNQAAVAWIVLLLVLLFLPVVLDRVGLPPRVEAYKSVGTNAGRVGGVIRSIYENPDDAGIVFLGSSLLDAGIDRELMEQGLAQGGHRIPVEILAMNWPGLDLQYFLLRDYLSRHKVCLVVWNLPEPHSRAYDSPHIQSYRWIRFGEYADALAGLPLQYRLSLYGEMVLGAPRQALSMVRPNLIANEALQEDASLMHTGYNRSSFVVDQFKAPDAAQLLPPESSSLDVVGPAPGVYQMHFARRILALVKSHGCSLVLIHVPIDAEYGQSKIPELANWQQEFADPVRMIGIPSSGLFPGLDKERYLHFYRDAHFNQNGAQVFTRSILPAVRQAYEQTNGD
jgi:hypothetical protein